MTSLLYRLDGTLIRLLVVLNIYYVSFCRNTFRIYTRREKRQDCERNSRYDHTHQSFHCTLF